MPQVILIGEKLNSSNQKARSILTERDETRLMKMVKDQADGGASYIDVNASMLMEEEEDALMWAADCILDKSELSVSLDSPNIELLMKAALKFGERSLINSVPCDKEAIEMAISAVRETGAHVIVMLKTETGIPGSVVERVELAEHTIKLFVDASIDSNRVFIDPVFTPVAMSRNGLVDVLETISKLKERFTDYRYIGGLSNISYGMPMRKLLNRTFLAMLISRGLDAIIADVTDSSLIKTLKASEYLIGHDRGGRGFLHYYRSRES